MYDWPFARSAVTETVALTLVRLRRNPNSGVLAVTSFKALNYFSSLWPADLEWPREVARPPKSRKAA